MSLCMGAYEVLIVEDDAAIRDTLIDIVEMIGFRHREATNGEIALRLMSEETPHLILSDIMMPVVDGVRLLQRVRADPHYFHIPVLMITAHTDVNVLNISNGLSVEELIYKPFDLADLALRIQLQIIWRAKLIKDFSRIKVNISMLKEWIFIQKLNRMLFNSTEAVSIQEVANRLGFTVLDFKDKLNNYSDFDFETYHFKFKMYTAKIYYDSGVRNISKLTTKCNYESKTDFCYHFMQLFQIDLISESGAYV